jgi:DNA-binding CsgD family transcriptional regulator/tetratricopeptide (TPR) repeat protein
MWRGFLFIFVGMKHIAWIGLLVLLTLSACDSATREARRMVKRAEQLADTLPDSTARLIDSVLRMPANFSERERMDMALLQAEALFGCRDGVHTVSTNTLSPLMDDDFFDDHDTISTSPELERAAAYYAGKKHYAKAAHAALYSGFVQQHYNEKEAAMRSFKEAEQYGKLAVDSLTVAQAQFKMGKMLLDNGMKQEALAMLQTAHSNFGNRLVDKALTQNIMSVCYMLRGDFDNAETCLSQSLLDMENSPSKVNKVNRKIWNNYAVLYRIQGKHDQAIDYLYRMLGNRIDDNEVFISSLNLGNVFLDKQEMDSAAKYYQRMEAFLPAVNVKKETIASAYSALSRFAEKQNDAILALQYREKHEKILYDLMIQRQEQTIYRIQQQYDYESLQNVMNKKIIQRHITILIISILLLITTILILFLQYRHKQLLKSEEEMKQQLDDLKQDLLQTVKTSVLDHEISSRLRLILKVHDKTPQGNDPKKEWQSLVWHIMNGKEDPFEAARSVLETAYPKLYSTIKESYPDLTETEAKVCLLSCSDLSNAEIAELLGLSTNTVNQNRSNLRKKLNLKADRMKEQLRSALSK